MAMFLSPTFPDDTSSSFAFNPLAPLLPDWLPPSSELPEDPEDAFARSLALALSGSGDAGVQRGREGGVEEGKQDGKESRRDVEDIELGLEVGEERREENLWEMAARSVSSKPTLLTWDTSPQVFKLPPLLSHHPELFYAALRKTLDTAKVVPLDPGYVANELRTVLVGYSGSLWIWDEGEDMFRPGAHAGDLLVIEGYTAAASSSISRRFLTIGTLLRRLQAVPDQLRGATGPWMHAFSHALNVVLSHIRVTLEKPPSCADRHLTGLHLEYEQQEAVLVALGDLLGRGTAQTPPYLPFSSNLVARIYKALEHAIAASAPHVVQCSFAFLLQLSSQPCIRAIEESLGLGGKVYQNGPVDEAVDMADGKADAVPNEVKVLEAVLPSDVRQTLERGRKSLALLKKACPGHVLCGRAAEDIDEAEHLKWLWRDSEIQRVQAEADEQADMLRALVERWKLGITVARDSAPPPISFPQAATVMDLFADISLLPLPSSSSPSDSNFFTDFLDSHPPPLLRSFAPSLPLLLRHIFAKVLARAKVIAQALLETLLSPSSQNGGADLLAHLHILRSFHLLAFAPFTDLLTNALFVHPSPEIAHAPGTRSRVRARLGIAALPHQVTGEEFAAVGLGVGLTQRGQWPPGGSDLSWILRRVVIDSLAADKRGKVEAAVENEVWEEADSIVGFAIRDIDEGDDAWLDPLAVEALDFLDLQYKAPRSLAVILSENVVWKYRRVFSFLLRVVRVDTVVRTLLQPTFRENLFPDAPRQVKLLYRVRFQAQSFVSALVYYLYDTAIRSPWEAFYTRLSRIHYTHVHDAEMQDVFAVAAYHDAVMDSILEGCLLRSHQTKLAGDLRECLSTSLLLGQLVLDLRRGTMSQEDGGQKLEALSDKFDQSLQSLIGLLKQYHAKDSQRNRTASGRRETGPRSANLADLLLRLTFTDFPRHTQA